MYLDFYTCIFRVNAGKQHDRGQLSRQGCNSDHVCLGNMTHRKLLEQKIKGDADTYFQHIHSWNLRLGNKAG